MDEYHRAIGTAEERFFSECDTNNGMLRYRVLRAMTDNGILRQFP
jgi:hypothetical protein